MSLTKSAHDDLLSRSELMRRYRLRSRRALAILAWVSLLALAIVLTASWILGPELRWLVAFLTLPITVVGVAAVSWRIERWAIRCPHCESDLSVFSERILAVGTCPKCDQQIVAEAGTMSLTRWRRINRVEQRRATISGLWIFTAFPLLIFLADCGEQASLLASTMLLVPLYGTFRLRHGRHRVQARWIAGFSLVMLVGFAALRLLT